LESEGTCIGALQIPPNGQPVLFMNDHPLTGGYPVIARLRSTIGIWWHRFQQVAKSNLKK
jgi:allophanate hydrolase subunit 2